MSRDARAAIAAVVAVIAVAILGFRFLGSPASQRLVQTDVRTLQALTQLANQIQNNFRAAKDELPANLDRLPDVAKRNPITRKPFIYKPKSKAEYDLCATFVAPSPEPQSQPNSTQPDDDRWHHPAGDFCFSLNASEPVPPAPFFY